MYTRMYALTVFAECYIGIFGIPSYLENFAWTLNALHKIQTLLKKKKRKRNYPPT